MLKCECEVKCVSVMRAIGGLHKWCRPFVFNLSLLCSFLWTALVTSRMWPLEVHTWLLVRDRASLRDRLYRARCVIGRASIHFFFVYCYCFGRWRSWPTSFIGPPYPVNYGRYNFFFTSWCPHGGYPLLISNQLGALFPDNL